MTSFHAILAVLFCGLALGCGAGQGKALEPKELCGVYRAKFPHGSETLTLENSNLFSQTYTRKEDGVSTTNSGTWNVDQGSREIVLSGAVLFDNRQGKRNQELEKTVWRLPVVRRLGAISLAIDSDGALEYQKVK